MADEAFRDFKLELALSQAQSLIQNVDRHINDTQPFKLAKTMETNERDKKVLALVLATCAESIRIASLFYFPAMPNKVAQLWRTWNCSPLNDPNDANSGFVAPLAELAVFNGKHSLNPGQMIAKGEALFMRANAEDPAPTPT